MVRMEGEAEVARRYEGEGMGKFFTHVSASRVSCGFLFLTEVGRERDPAEYIIVFGSNLLTLRPTMMQSNYFFFICFIHMCGRALAAPPPPKPQTLSLVDASSVHANPLSSNASSFT